MTVKMKKPLRAAAIPLTLIFAAHPALAQDSLEVNLAEVPEETEAGVDSYAPDFFERYAPTTALEMVARIPGFQINSQESRRGLGQGGANILINGERLTGKANPFDQLGRITAANVIKIEIVDGAALDIPGLSGRVANIYTETKGVSGTWLWRPEWRKGVEANLANYEATISGETGNLTYSAKLRDYSFRSGARGPETLRDPQGRVFEIRDEDGQNYGDRPGVSVNLTYAPKDQHVANLNAEYNLFNFNGRDVSKRLAVGPEGTTRETLFTNSEDEWNGQISGDYEFPFAKGKLKLIGLHQAEHSPSQNQFEVFEINSERSASRFIQTADEVESILRGEYSWSPTEGRDWTFGFEGAFNSLDIESHFTERSGDDPFMGGDPEISEVKEDRAEATLTHSRPLSEKWDFQASIGGEYSTLSQMSSLSEGAKKQSFFRPKGFVAATYKVDDSFSVRSKFEREVGQLNFFDFISSVNLTDNLDQAANPDLVPSQSWFGELELDKDFGQGNTFKARFYGSQITDLVDRIPLGVDGDAVGNIDSAFQYGVDFSGTLKGEKWGWDGTELNVQLELRDSSVDDPLTKLTRRLNDDKKYYYSFDFRHDVQNTSWAYGLFFDRYVESEVFRLSTQQQFTFTKPFVIAFVEHKDVAGLKVKVSALNLLNATEKFERSFFDNRRDLGKVERIELSERTFDPFLRLHVSGTF